MKKVKYLLQTENVMETFKKCQLIVIQNVNMDARCIIN